MPQITEQERPREKRVYLQRPGKEELAQHVKKNGRKLFGSNAIYDTAGDIFYWTWPDFHVATKETAIQPLLLSPLPPRVDINAPHTRYQKRIERRLNQIPDVETGIRAMDHIIANLRGKETDQAKGIELRIHELFDLFGNKDFTQITKGEFELARQKTFALLAKVNLDPDRVLSDEKKKMAEWLLKASFGEDSLGRRNKLIVIMALTAANRRAVERQLGLGTMEGKFIRMRESFIFERQLDRAIFESVADRLRPESLPSHELFKFPDRPSGNQGILLGMLGYMKFQLEQPHVKPYKTAGLQTAALLEETIKLIQYGKIKEVNEWQLFPWVRNKLLKTLETHKDIYLPEHKQEQHLETASNIRLQEYGQNN